MKKLVMLLSFALILGVISVNAQDAKKEVKKAPAKKEAAAKPAAPVAPEEAPAAE